MQSDANRRVAAVVCIVGFGSSGKTTLVERLVPELIALGLRVGSIKHASHGFEIDREGKDSARHARAGASPVVVFSATQLALVKRIDEEPALDHLVRDYFAGVDLVVAEGFKWEAAPKVLVTRAGREAPAMREGLLATWGDFALAGVPHFATAEVPALAGLIVERLLT